MNVRVCVPVDVHVRMCVHPCGWLCMGGGGGRGGDSGSLLSPPGDIMTRPQCYLEGHLPLLAEVRLVADQHHHDFSREELPLQVLQPLLSLAEGILKKGKRTSDKSYGQSSSAIPGKESRCPCHIV